MIDNFRIDIIVWIGGNILIQYIIIWSGKSAKRVNVRLTDLETVIFSLSHAFKSLNIGITIH